MPAELLKTATADQFRQDLLDAGKGNGKHGFLFPIPKQLKDGKKHIIKIKLNGTDLNLGPERPIEARASDREHSGEPIFLRGDEALPTRCQAEC